MNWNPQATVVHIESSSSAEEEEGEGEVQQMTDWGYDLLERENSRASHEPTTTAPDTAVTIRQSPLAFASVVSPVMNSNPPVAIEAVVEGNTVFEVHQIPLNTEFELASEDDGEIRQCLDRRVVGFIFIFSIFALIVHYTMYMSGFYTS